MKSININGFGDDLDVSLSDVDDVREPAANEIRVRVHAAGLNRADLLQIRGLYPPPAGVDPRIPGLEYAGVVESAGIDVHTFSTGDRVMGITAGCSFAEYVNVHADTAMLIPDRLSFTEAAAIPEAFITAHDAAFVQAGLKEGETLLIHAVGSGVGLAALQMAAAKGIKTIGTSRTADKLERCKEYGLEHAIALPDGPEFAEKVMSETDSKGVDVILDLVGAAYFDENLRSLATKGRLMLVGLTAGRKAEFDMGPALTKRLTIKGTVLRSRSTEEKIDATRRFADEMLPLFETGKLRPNVDGVFAAADVKEALEYLSSDRSFGKVVLEF
ncbi:MAG: NAD(P)H-quinone oxidoreductase [Acidobacteriota bacterium]|nr:MAG: NAD(P)H-quinone oxidoreductase [Acidobacteriota bacterium]